MRKTTVHIVNTVKNFMQRMHIYEQFDAATEAAYREFKFNDSRKVVVSVTTATFFLIIGLWIWDWTVDPLHAMDVLPIRLLLGMLGMIYPAAFVAGMRRMLLLWLMALIALSMEALYLHLLTMLENGLVYGMTGFIYWFMILIFIGLSFNLIPIVVTMAAVAILPNILVACGMAVRMPLPQYNALIWPTCLIAMFGNLALDRFYRRLFQYHRNIEHTARIDALTGIANRFHFNEAAPVLLQLSSRHRHPLSAFMVDIDHFKRVNDEHGHLMGDEVLRHIAWCMRTKLRSTDLLARYGGEEFVVILPETPPGAAMEVAEMIRATIAEAALDMGHDHSPLRVTISAGVVGYEVLPEGIGLEEFLRLADGALYEAKKSGRNRVIASPGCLGDPKDTKR